MTQPPPDYQTDTPPPRHFPDTTKGESTDVQLPKSPTTSEQ
jgi:hypothetical protein